MSYKKDLSQLDRVAARGETSWETWSELVLALLTDITESLNELEELDIKPDNEKMHTDIDKIKSEISSIKAQMKIIDEKYTVKLTSFIKWFLPAVGGTILVLVGKIVYEHIDDILRFFG